MTVTLQGHVCRVAPYPISIEWPLSLAAVPCRTLPPAGQAVHERYQIAPEVTIGLGVERWDFTKGILERFLAAGDLTRQKSPVTAE